jgi:hypothetical protein
MEVSKRRASIIALSIVITFIALRLYLHNSPNTDLNIGQYNIHHLFTGLLLISIGGIPMAVFQGKGKIMDLATCIFGIGLSMALDEWVYLITTDGTNASYLLPISFWGGAIMIGLAAVYTLFIYLCGIRTSKGI